MFPIQLNSRRRPIYGATLQKFGRLRQPLTNFYSFALYSPLSPVRQVKFVTPWKSKNLSSLAKICLAPLRTMITIVVLDIHFQAVL